MPWRFLFCSISYFVLGATYSMAAASFLVLFLASWNCSSLGFWLNCFKVDMKKRKFLDGPKKNYLWESIVLFGCYYLFVEGQKAGAVGKEKTQGCRSGTFERYPCLRADVANRFRQGPTTAATRAENRSHFGNRWVVVQKMGNGVSCGIMSGVLLRPQD